jgi:hypothetical protein
MLNKLLESNILFWLVHCTAIYLLVIALFLLTFLAIDIITVVATGKSWLQRGMHKYQNESQDKTSATIEPKSEMRATPKSRFSLQSRRCSMSTNFLYDSEIFLLTSRFSASMSARWRFKTSRPYWSKSDRMSLTTKNLLPYFGALMVILALSIIPD